MNELQTAFSELKSNSEKEISDLREQVASLSPSASKGKSGVHFSDKKLNAIICQSSCKCVIIIIIIHLKDPRFRITIIRSLVSCLQLQALKCCRVVLLKCVMIFVPRRSLIL